MLGMVQTSTGGLDVALPPMRVGTLMVVHRGVQAGQAGAGGEEQREEEESPDPEGPAGLSLEATMHGDSIATGQPSKPCPSRLLLTSQLHVSRGGADSGTGLSPEG
jgi:hypothetical protein